MSKIAEMARAEADETERENPDETEEEEAAEGEPTPEPEPEPEPEPASQAMTEQQAEREIGKLEKAATSYMGKAFPIAQALGMPVQPCPLCAYPGLALPRAAHEVTSDVEAAVLALIGKGVEPDYKASQAYARCEVCDGWGDVLTGAQKDVSRTAMCVTCGGKGYVNQPQPLPQPTPQNGAPLPGIVPLPTAGYEQPRPEPYYDYGERQWKLPPQPIGG
jgi:hypothetical protein